MAQKKAQGNLTITDTNDIERIYTVYAKSINNTTVPSTAKENWSENVSSAPGSGNYIWQRTVVEKSGTGEKTYSDPVCLTGEEGAEGKGISSITIQYGTSANWNTEPSNWYDNTPEYNSATPNYWTKTTINYTSGNPTIKTTQDKALTQAIYDAAIANSIATHANEDAQGAMSQAANGIKEIYRVWYRTNTTTAPSKPSTHVTETSNNIDNTWTKTKPIEKDNYRYYFYCEETITNGGVSSWTEPVLDTSNLSQYESGLLKAKVRNYWWDSEGAHIASGLSNGTEITKDSASSTYGYNVLTGLGGISFRYNTAKVVDLNSRTPSLDFYTFPVIASGGTTATEGHKTMQLGSNSLIFYDPDDGTTEQARLDTNGLTLKKGGVEAGEFGNNKAYIYVSTNNTSSRTIGLGTNKTDWRIIAGNKFGVDSLGNLYATSASITGAIVATSLDLTTNNVKINYSSINNTPDLTVYIAKDGVIGTEPSDSSASTSTGFKVSSAGLLKAANAVITGKIFASSGIIGGWNIGTDSNKSLYYGNQTPGATTTNLVLSPTSAVNTNAIAGSDTNKTWFISAGRNFGVDTTGAMYAQSGKIAGWTINANAMWKDTNEGTYPQYRVLINSNGVGTTNAVFGVGKKTSSSDTDFDYSQLFYVDGTGKLHASNAVISGDITATSGSLDSLTATNLTINSGSIASGVTIGGKNQSEYLNSNIQIGGRNLLLNSGTEVSEATTTTSATMCTNYWAISAQGKVVLGRLPQSLILSFDAKSTKADVVFTPYLRTDTSSEIGYSGTGVTLTTGWVRYTVVLTKDSTTYSLTRMWPVKSGVSGATISIKNVKLESGSKATDWTPAPEDVASDIASAATTTKYITKIDDAGIKVHAYNDSTNTSDTNNYTKINSSGLEVYKSGSSIAFFGASARIGTTGSSRVEIGSENGMNVFDSNNQLRINVSNTGLNIFRYDNSTRYNIASFGAVDSNSIPYTRIGRADQEKIIITPSGIDMYGYSNSTQKLMCHIGYSSSKSQSGMVDAPFFTFGLRKSGSSIGAYSIAMGYDVVSDYDGTVAFGEDTQALDTYDFACGISTIADGGAAFACGRNTQARAPYSFATGYNTITSEDAQMVVGLYNATAAGSLFVVGNGSQSTPKNAFVVNSNGNIAVQNGVYVYGHSSPIGTIKNAYLSTAKSVSSGSSAGTMLCSLSLEAGTWIIVSCVRAPVNGTGVRAANVSTTSGDASWNMDVPAISSYVTQLRMTHIVTPSVTTTYYLNALQTSGSALTYAAGSAGGYNFMQAIRIA